MLPRKYRLRKKKDFEGVFNKGKAVHNKEISLHFLKNDLNYSRFGFIVSTKAAKRAVSRNKVRRQLREIIRLKLDKIEKGLDIILVVRKEALQREFLELTECLFFLFKKAKISK